MSNKDVKPYSVEENPYYPGAGEARLKEFGVSVWALVAYFNSAGGDIERVAADYQLPREAVETALDYYRQHASAIDARIASHIAAFA